MCSRRYCDMDALGNTTIDAAGFNVEEELIIEGEFHPKEYSQERA